MIENVLASRYSCDEINSLFTRKKKYSLEREFWISVLKVQIQFGLKVPTEVVTRYEKIKEGSFVIGFTGWCHRFRDSNSYRNPDEDGNMQFPAFSKDAALLLLQRDIVEIGRAHV